MRYHGKQQRARVGEWWKDGIFLTMLQDRMAAAILVGWVLLTGERAEPRSWMTGATG